MESSLIAKPAHGGYVVDATVTQLARWGPQPIKPHFLSTLSLLVSWAGPFLRLSWEATVLEMKESRTVCPQPLRSDQATPLSLAPEPGLRTRNQAVHLT